MAIFSTCRRCGCKALVAVLVGATLHAAVHHQDICLREQPNGAALYCTKYVAEPVHTPDHGPSQQPLRSVITVATSTVATSTAATSTASSAGSTTVWTIGGPNST